MLGTSSVNKIYGMYAVHTQIRCCSQKSVTAGHPHILDLLFCTERLRVAAAVCHLMALLSQVSKYERRMTTLQQEVVLLRSKLEETTEMVIGLFDI